MIRRPATTFKHGLRTPWGLRWKGGKRTGIGYHRSLATRPSYEEGHTQPPLLTQTIPEHFASIVSKYGDRPAISTRAPFDPSSSSSRPPKLAALSYAAFDDLSNTLAHSLRALGVAKGDRVAVSLGNTHEFAALTYAAFKLGAVLVPLNPAFTSAQVASALNHLGASVLVIGAVTDLSYKPGRGRPNWEVLTSLVPDLRSGQGSVQSEVVPSLRRVVLVDNLDQHGEAARGAWPRGGVAELGSLVPFTELAQHGQTGGPTVQPDSPLHPHEVINIQFTSGTTSMPKAAQLTHANILNNGRLIAHRMGMTPDDRIVVPPPLFHCFGSVLGFMATASTGAEIVFPAPAFDPRATLEVCAGLADPPGEGEAKPMTGLYGVTTMLVALLELLGKGRDPGCADPVLRQLAARDFTQHLRKGIVAGSSVPQNLMEALFATLGLQDLVICYGMTETSPVSVMTAPDDPLDKRTGSVGRAMPHTSVRVVDPHDRTKVLPRGEAGELAAAGYLVMRGYYGDERVTEGAFLREEGKTWMHTGDEAVMDEQGYVSVTGRIKDLIIRGGENIHPLEIENVLFKHPLVADASVVGVPDDRLGEAVGVFVIVHEGVETQGDGGGTKKVMGKEDVRTWVRGHLSSHLVPQYVWFVDDYPKTASGKIQKFKLREMARELLKEEGA